jgi:tRNA A37 methylthiotransferase MiaB
MTEAGEKPEVVTFGCRLNMVESEVIKTLAEGGREKKSSA